MLCPYCGNYGNSDDVICPACGKLLPRGENRDTGVMAIRQGKRAREAAMAARTTEETETKEWQRRQGTDRAWAAPEPMPTPETHDRVYGDPDVFDAENMPVTDTAEIERRITHTVYGNDAESESHEQNETPLMRSRRSHAVKRSGVNWMVILLVAGTLLLSGVIGGLIWLSRSDDGKYFTLSRLHRDVEDASTYWRYGEELMDNGDLDGAIEMFVRAVELDEELDERANIDGLLQLATCYLRTDQTDKAEEIYIHIYTDLNPQSTDAYTREITLLRENGRDAEAAELMLLAYQRTGSSTFNRQRNQLLPSQPVTDLTAGVFEQRRTLHLVSPEDYDIYYIMNDAETAFFDEERSISEAWTHYEDGVFLDEGSWTIRAVCVNGDLKSDELSATYTVNLPSPHQPMCGLAPGTYSGRQSVALWPNPEDGDDTITIYYTIDGTIPDADSPVYVQGQKIKLLARNITLRAIAVNSYGKQSTVLERGFKLTSMPDPPKGYATDYPADTASIRLNNTSYDAFSAQFGAGGNGEDVEMERLGTCRRYHYSWGYATFQQVAGTRYIVEIYYTDNTISSPRSTRIGMTEDDIVKKFRDMGQVASPSGNRGLYSNDDGTGKIMMQEDGGKIIRYIAYTADSHYWQLDYNLDRSGACVSIYQRFIP